MASEQGKTITFRPESEDLRRRIVKRAAEKGLSVNEWLNRAATYGITNGGKLKVTTTVEAEF